jgi:DNA ligase-1
MGATAKKLEKRTLLADYLRTLSVGDAARAAQFVAGVPFAETDSRKLNVGGSLLSKAVAHRTGGTATSALLRGS